VIVLLYVPANAFAGIVTVTVGFQVAELTPTASVAVCTVAADVVSV
jgi:hypothetical protein